MLALFVFTGAQAAEAGLRVQSLIRERDHRLRQLEAQEAELSQKQSEEWMRKRAVELGFTPVAAEDIDYLVVAEIPAEDHIPPSPTSLLFTEEEVAISPAFRETLLEAVLRSILHGSGT
jgi:hypothetical protein